MKTKKEPFTLTKKEDIILTPADLNLCLGSGELKLCPFCGSRPMSSGEAIEGRAGKAIRWKVQCTGSDPTCVLIPNCFASVLAVDPDQEKARRTAVERWNRRSTTTRP